LKAYQRIKSRKSKIASTILDAVKTFFEQPEFVNQPERIREYVRWALRGDGPAYYRIPTPKTCVVDREHANYIVSLVLCEVVLAETCNPTLATRWLSSI
jgi:hypothetical protein